MAHPAKLIEYAAAIENALDRFLSPAKGIPPGLTEAMRYSTCGGGKRIRGALALGACAAVGGREENALPAACALEMVHAFSLIHDDLPCMDNDDLRRGKPTCHRVYGEALALLAGDGLLVQGILTLAGGSPAGTAATMETIGILLEALGPAGMIGGQVLDMQAERIKPDLPALRRMHAAKTGALIRAAVIIGAILGGSDDKGRNALDGYAASLGLAFQIVDDLLDLTGDLGQLGKAPGSDERNGKATFTSLLGVETARRTAKEEIDKALAALEPFGEKGSFLAEMARYVGERMD